MQSPSIASKAAYFAKTRKSNYAAGLRLDGFASTPQDAERPLASREELLKIYSHKLARCSINLE